MAGMAPSSPLFLQGFGLLTVTLRSMDSHLKLVPLLGFRVQGLGFRGLGFRV